MQVEQQILPTLLPSERNQPTVVGIDDMALYVPNLYFDIADLATARNIAREKLNHGLGLFQMAIPDVFEDTATMAANAILRLLLKTELHPQHIGRVYLATESALDGSKPTATYALDMVERYFEPTFGSNCFQHCDAVDLTFACVAGVDALQNTLDWVRGNANRIGIVVCSDVAKYEMESAGEYTQGAGAIALLVKQQPRLLAIGDTWGVAIKSVHDFFKPVRKAEKVQIIREVLSHTNADPTAATAVLAKLNESQAHNGVLDAYDAVLYLHKTTPVFDGHYSNICYQDRVREAFYHFKKQAGIAPTTDLIGTWERIAFHLPYAFHARRIFTDLFVQELKTTGAWSADFATTLGLTEATRPADLLKAVSQTTTYRNLVKTKIEKGERASGQVGNMYTASIFLALMGILEADWRDGNALEGATFGNIAYGSGSKAKVFEATVQTTWREVVAGFGLSEMLAQRTRLDYATYEALHRQQREEPVCPPQQTFVLKSIGESDATLGARYYEFVP